MKDYTIAENIPCYLVKAQTFPDGVMAAHQQLHAAFAFDGHRRFFGISRGLPGGGIDYSAAVEKMEGDTIAPNRFESFVIPAGRYRGTELPDFRKDIPAIGRLFSQLLQDPELDPNGFCLEWYYNMNDVQCTVKLVDK